MALVDKNVDKKGTRKVAQAYLKYLYTPEAQDIIARNFYRPRNTAAAAKYACNFPKISAVHDRQEFRRMGNAQKVQFDNGGLFDQIFEAAKR